MFLGRGTLMRVRYTILFGARLRSPSARSGHPPVLRFQHLKMHSINKRQSDSPLGMLLFSLRALREYAFDLLELALGKTI